MVKISNSDIARSIYEGAKENKGNLSSYLKNVVKFLAKKRLISKVPEILLQLKKIINKEEGILEAKVLSATKLGGEAKYSIMHSLQKRYDAKDVILDEAIDEKLLGGVRIEAGDEVIDLTMRNKIKKLQEHLLRP